MTEEKIEPGLKNMSDEARHWFRRVGEAWACAPEGTLPGMVVTPEEYDRLREMARPWTRLPDGRVMWGGVVVEVGDA